MTRQWQKMLGVAVTCGLLWLQPAVACPEHEGQQEKSESKADAAKATVKNATKATLKVDGMHCGGCKKRIQTALGKMDGVLKVDVVQPEKQVIVEYDADKLTVDKISKTLSELGYKVSSPS